jgi:hypothetical protein
MQAGRGACVDPKIKNSQRYLLAAPQSWKGCGSIGLSDQACKPRKYRLSARSEALPLKQVARQQRTRVRQKGFHPRRLDPSGVGPILMTKNLRQRLDLCHKPRFTRFCRDIHVRRRSPISQIASLSIPIASRINENLVTQ